MLKVYGPQKNIRALCNKFGAKRSMQRLRLTASDKDRGVPALTSVHSQWIVSGE